MFPRRRLACAAALVIAAAACGKKGPPLAPLVLVPAQITAFSAERSADAVFVTLTVPTTNVGGDTPGDIAAVEVFGATAEREPAIGEREPGEPWTLVQRVAVRRPVPPVPPPPPGSTAPVPPPVPLEPGLDQGQALTIREALTPELLAVVSPLPAPSTAPAADQGEAARALSFPVVAPVTDRTARRFYVARALSRRGRPGQWSSIRGVPTATPLGAPAPATPTYDAAAITITWTPPPGAAVAPAPPAAGLLPSRPFGPSAPLTRYNVYAPGPDPSPDALGVVTRSAPLNAAAIETTSYALSGVTFGQERCVVVRALQTIGDAVVEGPPSAPVCVTPQDTFPPPAPTALEAVGGLGVISLIWEPVDAADLAGYLVFRGENGGEPTAPLTPAPIRDASFEDRTVTAGVRYVYVVVAVDSATPANRSAPSNRAEETAR
ncbi:MAG: hypothetical protein AB7H93_00125 [Vicinamibacterales bacterium]